MGIKLNTSLREIIKKKTKNLRNAGQIPAVLYGPGYESLNITVEAKEFTKVFKEAGYSNLIQLSVNNKNPQVLIKEVQINPISQLPIHISLYAVDLAKKIVAEVPIQITGLAPAVKNNLGFLEVPSESVEIRCLPNDLPAKITVDISNLNKVGDSIQIKDLNLGDKIEIVNDQGTDLRIAFIAPPQKVVEEAVQQTATEGAETPAVTATEEPASPAKATK